MTCSYRMICGVVLASSLAVSSAFAQAQSRRATMTGAPGDGRCTFEVEVDGAAELEIHNDTGNLRTTSGSPATWRRLECNQPVPNNPSNFRFQGVDGRGRQQLLRDPNSSGGVAVIRFEDPQGGRQAYTGEITWRGGDSHWGGVGNWGGVPQNANGAPPANTNNGRGGDPRANNGGRGGDPRMDQGRGDMGRGGDPRMDQGRGGPPGGPPDNGGNWRQRITPAEAMNICRNQVMATRSVPRSRVQVRPGQVQRDGDSTINFSFTNDAGRTKNGTCVVSGTGQILQLQMEQGPNVVRATLNQALNICQDEAARRFAVAPGDVRVQHGADPGNGSYLVNYQAQQRNGRIGTGVCRVSPTGELEAFQRW
jgi:hypothetical protein